MDLLKVLKKLHVMKYSIMYCNININGTKAELFNLHMCLSI